MIIKSATFVHGDVNAQMGANLDTIGFLSYLEPSIAPRSSLGFAPVLYNLSSRAYEVVIHNLQQANQICSSALMFIALLACICEENNR